MPKYEAHITIAPCDGEEDKEEFLQEIADLNHFKVANLLMKKNHYTSKLDEFMTAHSHDYDRLVKQTIRCVWALQASGYEVWRWKVEEIHVDVRFPKSLMYR